MKVYLNGDLMTAEEARINPADRGLTLGDGLFETIAVLLPLAAALVAGLTMVPGRPAVSSNPRAAASTARWFSGSKGRPAGLPKG